MDSSRSTYILRVWPTPGRAGQRDRIACSLQLPATEETLYFASLEAALEFIRQRIQPPRPRP